MNSNPAEPGAAALIPRNATVATKYAIDDQNLFGETLPSVPRKRVVRSTFVNALNKKPASINIKTAENNVPATGIRFSRSSLSSSTD
ncbi:hypothetical protein CPT_Moby_033 [Stenotrophomonas phage Moby]|uniref:Uncharacterized protein n=1 Tax=Stenotrophomonas phage Moby TaxID=2601680 RepID=A0A5P8PM13_9CAUD|nr:hypothetical protein HWC58_gp033 [Stenotrophomonas phage Moby]QFR57781.1 hypothetical protein CPT_Moby_033 [Stenotrophomonas phage Moby]